MKIKLQFAFFWLMTAVMLLSAGTINVNAQWEKLETPFASNVTSVLVNDHGIFVSVSGSLGGLFFSSDYGETFEQISNFNYDKVESLGVTSVIGTNGIGIFKFSLENNIWKQELLKNTEELRAHDLLSYKGSIYAVSYPNGLYKSENHTDWDLAENGLPEETRVRRLKEFNDTLYLSTTTGLYFSTNEAADWEIYSESLSGKDVLNIEKTGNQLFVNLMWERNIYAFDHNRNHEIISCDNVPISNFTINMMVYFEGNLYLPLFEGGVYKLDLDDNSFSSLTASKDIGIHTTGLWLYNNEFYLGTAGYGLFMADVTFDELKPMNNGIKGYKIKTILQQDETLLLATDNSGLFISTNEGSSWMRPDSGFVESTIYDLINIDRHIIITTPGGVYLSDDTGKKWNMQGNPQAVKLASGKEFIYGTDGSVIFRSADLGVTWETVTDTQNIVYISIHANDLVLIAGTMNDGVFVSFDEGLTWEADNEGLDSKYIHIVFAHGDYIYAAQGSETVGLYRKKPGEGIWELVSDDIIHPTITSMYSNYNRLFIGAVLSRVYFSWNYGDTWTLIDAALPKSIKSTEDGSVNAMAFSDSYIFSARGMNSLYRHQYSDIIANIPDKPIGKDSSINIYPNPVNGPLTVSIDVAEEGPCRISVLNYMGIEITEIYKGRLSPGNNTFHLDTGKLNHGPYLLRITDNSGTTVKKFMIIN